MKKGLMLLVAGLMAFGATINAMASARLDSMSSDPRFVEDIDLIWLYPNKVLEYKNTVDFRLNQGGVAKDYGDGVEEWGGVIADESVLGGVLGVYVNRPSVSFTSAHSTTDMIGFDFNDPFRYYFSPVSGDKHLEAIQNVVDLFWGSNLGGADLGVHVNYGDNANTGGFWAEDALGLSVGLGFDSVGPFSQLNLHADYNTGHVTFGTEHDNGISTIKLGGLAQADLSTDNYARLFADFGLSSDNQTDIENEKLDSLTALVGMSCNHKVNGGKGLVSTGLAFSYVGGTDEIVSITEKTTEDSWNLFWNGSVESEVASWLTLRAGIEKAIVSRGYVTGSDVFDNSREDVKFSTGFGINWQNFTLDGNVDVASLENSIANVAPGNGIVFHNNNVNDGNMFMVSTADIRYKF